MGSAAAVAGVGGRWPLASRGGTELLVLVQIYQEGTQTEFAIFCLQVIHSTGVDCPLCCGLQSDLTVLSFAPLLLGGLSDTCIITGPSFAPLLLGGMRIADTSIGMHDKAIDPRAPTSGPPSPCLSPTHNSVGVQPRGGGFGTAFNAASISAAGAERAVFGPRPPPVPLSSPRGAVHRAAVHRAPVPSLNFVQVGSSAFEVVKAAKT